MHACGEVQQGVLPVPVGGGNGGEGRSQRVELQTGAALMVICREIIEYPGDRRMESIFQQRHGRVTGWRREAFSYRPSGLKVF